jgi:hypothetical protein
MPESGGKTGLTEAALLRGRAASMNVVSRNKGGFDASASNKERGALPERSAFVAPPATSRRNLRIWMPRWVCGEALSRVHHRSHMTCIIRMKSV